MDRGDLEQGNVSLIDEMHADDFIYHDLHASPQGKHDNDSIKGLIIDLRQACPELRAVIDDLVAAEDRIAIRWTAKCIHGHTMFGYPPTNKRPIWHGITILHLKNSRITGSWWLTDLREQLADLGSL